MYEDIVNEIGTFQAMDRRSQIITSIKDTEKSLSGTIGAETRDYLNSYLDDLKNELKEMGDN